MTHKLCRRHTSPRPVTNYHPLYSLPALISISLSSPVRSTSISHAITNKTRATTRTSKTRPTTSHLRISAYTHSTNPSEAPRPQEEFYIGTPLVLILTIYSGALPSTRPGRFLGRDPRRASAKDVLPMHRLTGSLFAYLLDRTLILFGLGVLCICLLPHRPPRFE